MLGRICRRNAHANAAADSAAALAAPVTATTACSSGWIKTAGAAAAPPTCSCPRTPAMTSPVEMPILRGRDDTGNLKRANRELLLCVCVFVNSFSWATHPIAHSASLTAARTLSRAGTEAQQAVRGARPGHRQTCSARRGRSSRGSARGRRSSPPPRRARPRTPAARCPASGPPHGVARRCLTIPIPVPPPPHLPPIPPRQPSPPLSPVPPPPTKAGAKRLAARPRPPASVLQIPSSFPFSPSQ